MTGTPPIAPVLAEFAVTCRGGLPAAVRADVVGRVLDVVGNALAAGELTAPDEPHQVMLRLLRRRGGAEDASLLVHGAAQRLPAPAAALVNGTLAHSLDFDDTHLPSVLHPSACVVPAALAVAEAEGRSGAELLDAVAAGVEVCNRLGMASYVPRLRNSLFLQKGFHATSICGTIGAATAAAVLYGLDADGIVSAMGIAASMGAGIIEANRTGGTVKRVHCGWAAQAGVEAALFAAEGITGPSTVFEGRFGFLQAYLDDQYDAGVITAGLGRDWELSRTVYKPYPSNHFTHPGIDCALALRREGLNPERIESVELGMAAAMFRTIGEPLAEKVAPRSCYHAKFSGPYTVATALLGGGGLGVYLDDFDAAALADPARQALTRRVSVFVDEECDALFPHAFSAVLRARTTDGRSWEHRVQSSRGGPGHPLSREELATKFRLNAGRVLTPEAGDATATAIAALPLQDRVGPVVRP